MMELDTFATPKSVPQTHDDYELEKAYLRECYPDYYERILARLYKKPLVTVTGTPGIGKSMFYLYFFQRYRQENPDKKVVTVSFDEKQSVMNCRVWNSLNEMQQGHAAFVDNGKIVPTKLEYMHLYDGPPNHWPERPSDENRGKVGMVAFSSPNKNWLKVSAKMKTHSLVYMPQ